MPQCRGVRPPYGNAIDAIRVDHILYFAEYHHVPIATAIKIVRLCDGDTRAAEAAVTVIKSHYFQSISAK